MQWYLFRRLLPSIQSMLLGGLLGVLCWANVSSMKVADSPLQKLLGSVSDRHWLSARVQRVLMSVALFGYATTFDM